MITLPLDSFHSAFLDVGAGLGLLVCPAAETDVWLDRESVHGAAWAEVIARLDSLGWRPRRDGAGLLRRVGSADGGSLVVEVEMRQGAGTVGEEAWRRLCDAAGIVRDAPRPHA